MGGFRVQVLDARFSGNSEFVWVASRGESAQCPNERDYLEAGAKDHVRMTFLP